MNSQAQVQEGQLTPEQQDLLRRAGECEGSVLVRRIFGLVFPGQSYRQWAERHGFSYPLVKVVVSGHRKAGPKTEAVRTALVKDLGLPEWVLFGADS